MPLILIPSCNCFEILEIIIPQVQWEIVCETNNQSKMCSEISSNFHRFSFPHLRNFSNHLHNSFLIYTTNTIVFLPNTNLIFLHCLSICIFMTFPSVILILLDAIIWKITPCREKEILLSPIIVGNLEITCVCFRCEICERGNTSREWNVVEHITCFSV
jgi:hypothetical protein